MMSVKLTADEFQYIRLFESITGAIVKDCVVDEHDNRIIFVVKPGHIGLAIGRSGKNIRQIRSMLKRDVDVVEYSSKPEVFVRNCLNPNVNLKVRLVDKPDGKKVAMVTVNPKYRGLTIGRNGRNVSRARLLAKRHFNIEDVIIE